jgi:hypothetical protein
MTEVIPVAYCPWCRATVAEDHECIADDFRQHGTPGDMAEVGC